MKNSSWRIVGSEGWIPFGDKSIYDPRDLADCAPDLPVRALIRPPIRMRRGEVWISLSPEPPTMLGWPDTRDFCPHDLKPSECERCERYRHWSRKYDLRNAKSDAAQEAAYEAGCARRLILYREQQRKYRRYRYLRRLSMKACGFKSNTAIYSRYRTK